jgi:hypothetical protein
MSGGLRFSVVIAGLVVLMGAILEGHDKYVANNQKISYDQVLGNIMSLNDLPDGERRKKVDEFLSSLEHSILPRTKRAARTD